MKSLFKSFTPPSDDAIQTAWKSDETIFVFDTNVLLNLYGFEQQTRKDFFAAVQKIEDKVWIPFHEGLEFHNQRLNIISREKKIFQDLKSKPEQLLSNLKTELSGHQLQKKFPKIQELSQQLILSIESAINEFKKKVDPWDKKQPDVRSHDEVLQKIYSITEGRVGPPPKDQKWLDELYLEGKNRYEKRIPPGFKDTGKDSATGSKPMFYHNNLTYERKFGDLIIWRQITEHASTPLIKNVFFITDDTKEDWWEIMKSSGSKIIGPLEALRSEIYNDSAVEFFHMYSTSDFLNNAQKALNVKLHDSSIKDAIKNQTQRLMNYDTLATDSTSLIMEKYRNALLEAEKYNLSRHLYPNMNYNLDEEYKKLSIFSENEKLEKAAQTLAIFKKDLENTTNNHLQDTNADRIANIFYHYQMMNSLKDINQAHIHKSTIDDDDPS
ncbi:PIN-like domain-containing protein [Pseudomonas helleri]|uniref:PIN-like domain-containing protein n=1 Tax=Pseudomonas helleri TaxID=1608996 RepID=UPI00069EB1DB|nr:PIN-like domain-containing protein [Pseudomonas helleri]